MKKSKVIASSILSFGLLFSSTAAFADDSTTAPSDTNSTSAPSQTNGKAGLEQQIQNLQNRQQKMQQREQNQQQRAAVKAEIAKLKTLQQQNIALNGQLKEAAKAFRQKIESSIQSDKTSKDFSNLSDLKSKVDQVKTALNSVKTLRDAREKYLQQARTSLKSKDFNGALSAVQQAETQASNLISTKQQAISTIQSL